MIAESSVDIIRNQVSLLEVVSYYVPLKRRGSRYVGLCPFHSEKTPSFGVHSTLQFYKCFGCDASGDIFKFIQQIEGATFPEALRILAERYGINLQQDRLRHVPKPEYDRARRLAVEAVDIRSKARRAFIVRLLRLALLRLRLGNHLTRISGSNLRRWQAVDDRIDDHMIRVGSALVTVCNASATEILSASRGLWADAA